LAPWKQAEQDRTTKAIHRSMYLTDPDGSVS
jgi:hypothetical protein